MQIERQMTYSSVPDHTAPLGAVSVGPALISLGSYRKSGSVYTINGSCEMGTKSNGKYHYGMNFDT